MACGGLTVWTEMCRSAAEHDALDERPAFAARLAFTIVDAMQGLKISGQTIGVAVVAERAPTMPQCSAKCRLDRSIETRDLILAQDV